MSLYLEQIRQLVKLQHVDDDIHAVKAELKAAPQEVDALTQRFQSQDTQRNRVLDKIQHLVEQQKRLNSDIDDDSSRIKKSKSKLMQVGNNREYQAMMREVDTMERQNRSREEEEHVMAEEMTLAQTTLKEVEGVWNSLKAELETKTANLDKRLEEANKQLTKLEKKRSSTDAEVPAPVLSRYEFIRRRMEHPVIVPVDEGVCTGCHIAIPPQVYIELQRGMQILSCPNCQRLIFWSHDFQEGGESVD